ncbi:MAG: AAA family ATPase [Paracoccaceae bacterium]|nr:AAA family ATPase [Paracoccaceae bacterium]
MRLRRLDLTRYGKFTDKSLEFGATPADGPDFHIIYGPNEAGKSTTMQGWLDLLYGIPTQSRMDFLHPYGAMRLGAAIEAGDAVTEVVRTKGRNGTLTDPAGHVQPETLVQGLLGGIDRAGYEAMFSLDDETLEKGGESILSSQGDLGQMLFTASSGLAEMGQALDGLRGQTAAFFKPGGRTGGLADLKKALAAVEQRIADLDVGARDFAARAAARDQAQAAFDAAQAAQKETVAQLDLVERQWGALPLVNRLTVLEAELSALPELPAVPPGWAAELNDLTRAQGQTAVRLEAQEGQLAGLRAELEAATDDPAMLAQEAAMAEAEALKSDYDGAVRDLPARRAEADQVQGQIDDLLRQLGAAGADPAVLRLPPPVVASLRALMAQHSGVRAALETAQTEQAAAAERLALLRAQAGEVAGDAPDVELLAGLVEGALRDDPDAGVERALGLEAAARDRLAAALARLQPWGGDGAALLALRLPTPAAVQGWRQEMAAAQRAADQARADAARAGDEVARVRAGMQAAVAAGQVTLEDAARVRAARENLWSAHLAALDAATAAAFEAGLRQDDQVPAALARALGAALHRAAAEARLAALEIERARHMAEAEAAEARLGLLREGLQRALPAGLDPASPPEALEDWMRRREAALEVHAQWQAAARDLAAAERRQVAAREALAAGLAVAGQDVAAAAPLAVLLAQGRLLLERAQGQAAQRAAREAAVTDLHRRQAALARADAGMAAWRDHWAAAVAQVPLDLGDPDVAAMGAVLDQVQAVEQAWRDLRGLRDRIGKMQANRAAFEAAVAALAARLDMPAGPDTLACWQGLRDRQRAAAEGQALRLALQDKIADGAQVAQGLREALAVTEARLAAFCAHFGCEDAALLHEVVAQAARRQDLLAERDRLVRDLCEGMGTEALDQALAAVAGLERPALAAEREALVAMQQRQAQALQEGYADLTQAEARIAAVGGDDAVARLQEERQTLLLQIEEEAQAFVRLRLGIVAVDHALQRYRDSHRSAMMQRASEAFCTITRGDYTGLAAQSEGEREVLVALAASGASKLARDLSKGTRFQLYLALRVAGYHEIAAARGTVPFIADDILETFDDDRAAETFALLAGMAGVGQVIYLTHHRHLCEIARRICPDVRIHALG